LESKDVSKFGKRVLTMAKQEGKGWFAIMLGQHISYKTVIPEYILESIVFAKEVYSNNLIADIVEYRLNKTFEEDDKLDYTKCFEILAKFRNQSSSIKDLKTEIQTANKHDQILSFLNLFK